MYYLANIENVWIWVAIAVVILVLFGGSKIPEMMKGIGQGVKELKKGMNEDDDELKQHEAREREVRARVEEQMRREEEERRNTGSIKGGSI